MAAADVVSQALLSSAFGVVFCGVGLMMRGVLAGDIRPGQRWARQD